MLTHKPLISIITVVYNSENYLEKTIQSIVSQTYCNVQLIIIDGGSKDGTLDIIKKYESSIFYWISEPDKGLYDAMNKGMQAATGDYVWFINSGDEIYNHSILEKLFSNPTHADVVYGETMIINEAGAELGLRRLKTPIQLTWKSLKAGMLVSHQAILVKRSITSLYDVRYKFSADYNWVIAALKKADTIENTEQTIVKFLDGGLTKSNIVPGLKERFRIMCYYYGTIPTLLRHIPIGLKFLFFIFRHRRF